MGKYDKRVTVSNFSDAVQNQIDLYCKELQTSIPDVVEQSAKKCLQSIKVHVAQAGIKDKTYSKSWKKETVAKNAWGTYMRVYSEKHYRIAHLLENGHVVKNKSGVILGSSRARPHLIYAEQESIQFLENMLKKTIGG